MQVGANIRDLKTSSYTFVNSHRDCVIIAFVRMFSLMKTKLRRTRFVVFVFKHYWECIFKEYNIVLILYRVSENFQNTSLCTSISGTPSILVWYINTIPSPNLLDFVYGFMDEWMDDIFSHHFYILKYKPLFYWYHQKSLLTRKGITLIKRF